MNILSFILLVNFFLPSIVLFASCRKNLEDKFTILPFEIGEQVVTETADDDMFSVEGVFYFMGNEYERVWWSTNGFVEISNSIPSSLSFRCSVANTSHIMYADRKLIAPACDDLKTKVSSAGERIYSRSSSNKYDIIYPSDFDSISEYLETHFFSQYQEEDEFIFGIEISWFFVLTFDRVSFIHEEETRQSFQLILATDETKEMSFALYQYPRNGLNGGKDIDKPNLVGIIDGTEKQVIIRDEIFNRGSDNTQKCTVYPECINYGTNIDVEGNYIFRLDGTILSFFEPRSCEGEYDYKSCNRPFGVCNTTSLECLCDEEEEEYFFFGEECKDSFVCNNISAAALDDDVCGGGEGNKCIGWNNCSCPENVSGKDCEIFQCFGKNRTSQSVCNFGEGDCVYKDVCNCSNPNVGGKECNQSACFWKERSLSSSFRNSTSSNNNYIIFPLVQIVDDFDDDDNSPQSISSDYWDVERCGGFEVKFRGGCGGDSGGYLFFTGNRSRTLVSHPLLGSVQISLSFWFTQGRSDDSGQNQDIMFPECNLEFEEDEDEDDSIFDVYLRIVSDEDENIHFFETVLSRNNGNPYLYQITPIFVPETSRLIIKQSLFNDDDWDGRGGEWGFDRLVLWTSLVDDNIPCSGRGVCRSDGNCECVDDDDGSSSNEECEIIKCFGRPSNDPNVCNGKGKCVGHDLCECDDMNVVGGGEGSEQQQFLPTNSHDCSGMSCYGIPSSSSLVCSGHGQCNKNEYDYRNNICCCDYGFYGFECSSGLDYEDDYVFEPQCGVSFQTNSLLWEFVHGGEFTTGNIKCGSVSGQSLYFSSSSGSLVGSERDLLSRWMPYPLLTSSSNSLELSFWLVQGRGTPGCTYSGMSSYLEIVIESDFYDEDSQTDISERVETEIVEEIDLKEYREWSFVRVPYLVPSNASMYRIVIRQKMFSVESDEWSIDSIQISEIESSVAEYKDWWVIILLGLFGFAIVVALMVISVVVIYAICYRIKLALRDYVEKKTSNFFEELREISEEENYDQWSVEGSTSTSNNNNDTSSGSDEEEIRLVVDKKEDPNEVELENIGTSIENCNNVNKTSSL